jgi:voltage-gated potassium channel
LPNCGAMLGVILMLGRFGKAVRHAARSPEFRGLAVAAILMIGTGTVVYATLEHWSVVDAFYFAVSTLTTTTPTGLVLTHTITKLFTAIYVLLGIMIILEFARRIAVAYGELRIAHRKKHADS